MRNNRKYFTLIEGVSKYTQNNKLVSITIIVALLGVFAFNYYEYFFNYFVPGIAPDSLDYFRTVVLWKNGDIASVNSDLDIPLGYSYLLYVYNIVFEGHELFIVFQILILYFSVYYFIKSVITWNKLVGMFLIIPLSIFLMHPMSIYYSVTYLTESIYTSFLFIILGQVFRLYKGSSLNKFQLILFGISICIPILLRPNGVFVLILIAIFLFNYFRSKDNKFLLVVKSFFVTSIILLFVTKLTCGYFNYGNIKRAIDYFDSDSKNYANSQHSVINDENTFSEYMNLTGFQSKPFYNNLLSSLVYMDMVRPIEEFNGKSRPVDFNDELKEILLKEYNNRSEEFVAIGTHKLNKLEDVGNLSLIIKFNQYVYFILNKFMYKNWLSFLFHILFVVNIVLLFSKRSDMFCQISVLLGVFFYVSNFLVYFLNIGFQYRYGFPVVWLSYAMPAVFLVNIYKAFTSQFKCRYPKI